MTDETEHELDLDDEALELAAGGIILITTPSQSPTQPNITYNSTIYYTP